MTTYIYLTHGERTVMMAKSATFRDFQWAIRKNFPMLASIFNLVILFKPKLENGDTSSHWVEVDRSAYGAIYEGAEVFINVADPTTKRYLFALPDGNQSNVVPQPQMPGTDGMGNRINRTVGGVLLDTQVSIKDIEPSRSPKPTSYLGGSEQSHKFERSGGASYTTGQVGASRGFRRSAKSVPDPNDCQEAGWPGMEDLARECRLIEVENEIADNKWGIDQVDVKSEGEHKGKDPDDANDDGKEPSLGPTEKGWYTGTENYSRDGLDDEHDNPHMLCECHTATFVGEATILPAGGALSYENGQCCGTNDCNTAGKPVLHTNVNNMRGPSPYYARSYKHPGPPFGPSHPSPSPSPSPSLGKPTTQGFPPWGSSMSSPQGVALPPKTNWNFDEDAKSEGKHSFFGPSDYHAEGTPISRPSSRAPFQVLGGNGRGWSGAFDHNDNADKKYSHTAFTHSMSPPNYNGHNNIHGVPAPGPNQGYNGWSTVRKIGPPSAFVAPYGGGYANQVSQNAHYNQVHCYGTSDWSPPRRGPYTNQHNNQHHQHQHHHWPQQSHAHSHHAHHSQAHKFHRRPPQGHPLPPRGSFTPGDPGRCVTGSPVAMTRNRPDHLAHYWSKKDGQDKGQTWANGDDYQTQAQARYGQQTFGFQTGSHLGRGDDGHGVRRGQKSKGEGNASEDFWYATPENDIKKSDSGLEKGGFKRSRAVVHEGKRSADKPRQWKCAGWELSDKGWNQPPKIDDKW